MQCEFENIPCAISGNFVCKKCKQCGHQIGLAAAIANTRWEEIHAGIKTNCPNNRKHVMPDGGVVMAAPEPVTGQDFGAVSKNISANLAGQPTQKPMPTIPDDGTGPGAQLKKYLSRIGIKASPNCSCNARAKYMDFMGTVWCENNIDTIVGWLKEEAEKRRLPFIDWPARSLVKRAIAAAKKAQAAQYDKQNREENAVQSTAT